MRRELALRSGVAGRCTFIIKENARRLRQETLMKTLFPVLILTALLCGCPDTKVPKGPPLTPQPKAITKASSGFGSLAAAGYSQPDNITHS